jgi:hypothetical protein
MVHRLIDTHPIIYMHVWFLTPFLLHSIYFSLLNLSVQNQRQPPSEADKITEAIENYSTLFDSTAPITFISTAPPPTPKETLTMPWKTPTPLIVKPDFAKGSRKGSGHTRKPSL